MKDPEESVRAMLAELNIEKYLQVLVHDDSALVRRCVALCERPEYCDMLVNDNDDIVRSIAQIGRS